MTTHQRAIIPAIAALFAIVAQRAPAQSAGSFAGDFVGVKIIPTIACAAGDTELSCEKGGSAFLYATIKLPGSRSKYGLISASLETAILTGTGVTGGTGKQTATAFGSIVVRPEVTAPNGQKVPVWPPEVTFDERTQTLTANLSGCITNPDTLGLPVTTCTDPEMIDLLLSTMSAHSFNFLYENYGTGQYKVKLNIGVTAKATSSQTLAANARVGVGVGVGSLGVQLVQVQTPFSSLCFDLVNNTSC